MKRGLRTVNYGLRTGHKIQIGIKRGRETTDWV